MISITHRTKSWRVWQKSAMASLGSLLGPRPTRSVIFQKLLLCLTVRLAFALRCLQGNVVAGIWSRHFHAQSWVVVG